LAGIQETFREAFCKPTALKFSTPQPYEVMVPMIVKVDTDTRMQMLPFHMFLPHEWLYSLSQTGLEDELLGLQRLLKFWQGQSKEDPKLKLNPALSGDNAGRCLF
jgi:hypothetical protein